MSRARCSRALLFSLTECRSLVAPLLSMTRKPRTARVDVESIRAQKAEQRQASLARQLDRETRRRADRGDDRDAGHECLLHQLEAHAAAHHEYSLICWQPPREQLDTDDLVERVMTADVLAQRHQSAIEIEQGRRMKSARGVESWLRATKTLRQSANQRHLDDRFGRPQRVAGCRAERRSRGLAAHPAARARERMPLYTREIDRQSRRKHDARRAPATRAHGEDLLATTPEPFGEEKPGRELEVVAGCSHRHRDRRDALLCALGPFNPDLERLLDREQISADSVRARSAARDLDLFDSVDHPVTSRYDPRDRTRAPAAQAARNCGTRTFESRRICLPFANR